MPTRAGWALAAVGAGTLMIGRLFGWVELFALGVAVIVLVAGAVLLVRGRLFTLGVRRTVRPGRLHVGESARVELAVANRGRLTTPVMTLRDPVAGTVGARVRLAPLTAGKERHAAYRLPTSRRGVLAIGPLEAIRTDPLGLARKRLAVSGTVEIVVYPKVHRVSPPPGGREQPAAVRNRALAQASRRDTFAGLREYVEGDDLRLVHWRSSARTGELVVRQDETPRPQATAVVLDVRRTAHAGTSLEQAVSVAASVVLASQRASQEVVLASTDGTALLLRPTESAAPLLEYLAVAHLASFGSLRATLSGAIGVLGAGSVVLVTGRAVTSELNSLAASRHGLLVFAVATDGSAPNTSGTMPGVRIIDGGTEERFVTSWEHTMNTAVRDRITGALA
jgi:uncharacterized protein (DUF58 family)